MTDQVISIKRYPNRRYYSRNQSKYVSLPEIEEMVKAGSVVEIHDSQTGEDLTRSVLTQIIMERQPEKMSLFPTDMLHFILRSNDTMSGFLRDYFRHSLTYLDFLQQHGTMASALKRPMHWMKLWLDGIAPNSQREDEEENPANGSEAPLSSRLEQLERRLHELESKGS